MKVQLNMTKLDRCVVSVDVCLTGNKSQVVSDCDALEGSAKMLQPHIDQKNQHSVSVDYRDKIISLFFHMLTNMVSVKPGQTNFTIDHVRFDQYHHIKSSTFLEIFAKIEILKDLQNERNAKKS